MAKLLLLILLLTNTTLYAGGELSVTPKYNIGKQKTGYKFSLGAYENLHKNFYLNPYTEYEKNFEEESEVYGKIDLNYHVGKRVVIGTGVGTKNLEKNETDVHMTLTIKLW